MKPVYFIFLFAVHAMASPAAFKSDEDHLPYRHQWGQWLVSVVSGSNGYECRIEDGSNRVIRRVDGCFMHVDFPDLDGNGQSEYLRVMAYPDNNTLADIRTYCFTRSPSIRNILAMPYGFDDIRNLDHSGRPELIADDPAPLEWLSSLSHAYSPNVTLVLKWNGHRYVVANRRFPSFIRQKALADRKSFIEARARFEKGTFDTDGDDIISPAVGYWAGLATIDEEAGVARWIRARLPEGLRDDFSDSVAEARARLARIPAQITTDQRPAIPSP